MYSDSVGNNGDISSVFSLSQLDLPWVARSPPTMSPFYSRPRLARQAQNMIPGREGGRQDSPPFHRNVVSRRPRIPLIQPGPARVSPPHGQPRQPRSRGGRPRDDGRSARSPHQIHGPKMARSDYQTVKAVWERSGTFRLTGRLRPPAQADGSANLVEWQPRGGCGPPDPHGVPPCCTREVRSMDASSGEPGCRKSDP